MLAGYAPGPILEAACWAHARRKQRLVLVLIGRNDLDAKQSKSLVLGQGFWK
jgi:hypothetical protein